MARNRGSDDYVSEDEDYGRDDNNTVRLLLYGGIGLFLLAAVGIILVSVLGIGNPPPVIPTPTPVPQIAADDNEARSNTLVINPTALITGSAGITPTDMGIGKRLETSRYIMQFTRPTYPISTEVLPLETSIINLIGNAKRSVDVATYNLELSSVADALKAAKERGVVVRVVVDKDSTVGYNPAISITLQAGIPIVTDTRPALMHESFIIFDASAPDAKVAMGSLNLTVGDMYRSNNNWMLLTVPQAASIYATEFDRLYNKQYGPAKPTTLAAPIVLDNSVVVENYFGPQNQLASRVINRINAARTSVNFMCYSFTSKPIADAMTSRQKAGVKVTGVVEKSIIEPLYSQFTPLKNAGVEVYEDGNPFAMHHKVIIIDEKTVIFGTFNFSENADKQNDENLIIIDDPNLAKFFKEEFNVVVGIAKAPPAK